MTYGSPGPYSWICPVHSKGLKIKTLINPTSLQASEKRLGSFLSIVSAHGTDEKSFEVLTEEGINFQFRIFWGKQQQKQEERYQSQAAT